jgi:hypothetical protein
MARPDGAHATYNLDGTVSIHRTEIDAHRARGTVREYVYWPYGMTLAEARAAANAPVKSAKTRAVVEPAEEVQT